MSNNVQPGTFGFLVNDVSRLMRSEMDRRTDEAGLGLTSGEGRTLFHARLAGPVRQTMLAERLGVEAMTLSSVLDRLEAKGFVERLPDPADRRAKLVQVTASGIEVVQQIEPIAAGIRADAAQGLTAEEWEFFLTMLRKTRANLLAVRAEAKNSEGPAA